MYRNAHTCMERRLADGPGMVWLLTGQGMWLKVDGLLANMKQANQAL